MTGLKVQDIRRTLKLTQAQMGSIVGASPCTVSRWEARGASDTACDPWHLQMLTLLDQYLSQLSETETTAFVKEINQTLLTRGNMFTLFKILEATFVSKLSKTC